jgi:hypothetical protein
MTAFATTIFDPVILLLKEALRSSNFRFKIIPVILGILFADLKKSSKCY